MNNPKIQLTTDEINLIASKPENYHHHPRYQYQGTQASDQALHLMSKLKKRKPQRPWGMILNTDPISKQGQHWVALYAPDHSDRIEIMDSYGSQWLKKGYVANDYMSELLKHVDIVEMPPLQSNTSYVCGYYCLAYLYVRTKKRGFSYFVKPFLDLNVKQRDRMVYNFVRRVMMNKKMKCKCKRVREHSAQGCVCKKDCNQCISCEDH